MTVVASKLHSSEPLVEDVGLYPAAKAGLSDLNSLSSTGSKTSGYDQIMLQSILLRKESIYY